MEIDLKSFKIDFKFYISKFFVILPPTGKSLSTVPRGCPAPLPVAARLLHRPRDWQPAA